MGVGHGLRRCQTAAHTALEMTCGGSGTTVESVPGPTSRQALPMELPVCTTHKEEWLWAEQSKQIEITYYNIKLFMICLNQGIQCQEAEH